MKSAHPINHRRLTAAVTAATVAFSALLALSACGSSSPPSCPVSRSGAVDIVAGGPRPCVLHGRSTTAVAPGTDTGRHGRPGGSGKAAGPGKPLGGGAAKQQPKVPAAPAPKVPAPPRPPSLIKR